MPRRAAQQQQRDRREREEDAHGELGDAPLRRPWRTRLALLATALLARSAVHQSVSDSQPERQRPCMLSTSRHKETSSVRTSQGPLNIAGWGGYLSAKIKAGKNCVMYMIVVIHRASNNHQ
jgi:hypothetical protein